MESINEKSEAVVGEQSAPPENLDASPSVQPGRAQTSMAGIERSGGPKTQQGKENSKGNSMKHGIFSKAALLKGEPRTAFESLLTGLRADLKPEGALEEILVDKLASLIWRLRRLIIADGQRTQNGFADEYKPVALVSLDGLMRYESNLERAIERTLNQLQRLQRIRRGQPEPPTLHVNLAA